MLISMAVGTALAVNGDREAMVEAFDRITIEEAAKRFAVQSGTHHIPA